MARNSLSCRPSIERFAAAAFPFTRRTRRNGCLSLLMLFALLELLIRRSLLLRRWDIALALWLLLRLRLDRHLPGRLGIARWTLGYEYGWSL